MVRAVMIICASQIHLQSQGNQSITHYCSVMKHRNCLVCGTQRRFNTCCCYCFQCCCICVPCTFIEHLLVPRYSEPQYWGTDKAWCRVRTENAEEYNWNTSWKHRFESWNTIGKPGWHLAGVLVGRIPNIETQGGPGSFEGGAGAQLFVECAARQYLGGELLVSSAAGARGRLWDARLLARVPQRLPDHGMAWLPQRLCCCMIMALAVPCIGIKRSSLYSCGIFESCGG